MALEQHSSLETRFRQQVENAAEYLVPFVAQAQPLTAESRVLEIGCGEGGVLRAFSAIGCHVLGVDLSAYRIDKAKELMQPEIAASVADFVAQNVYDADFVAKYRGSFDLIVLKDTIEHIPEQEKFIPHIIQLLAPKGKLFFGFPPWWMPFGGHQQICRSKIAAMLPYYHLLPMWAYKLLLKAFGESAQTLIDLEEIKDTGISTHRFERILRQSKLRIVRRTHFLINPIYRYKFGLEAREQAAWITAIPYLRDFVTTCAWYVVEVE